MLYVEELHQRCSHRRFTTIVERMTQLLTLPNQPPPPPRSSQMPLEQIQIQKPDSPEPLSLQNRQQFRI